MYDALRTAIVIIVVGLTYAWLCAVGASGQ